MPTPQLTESQIEIFAIQQLVREGYAYALGPELFGGGDAGAVQRRNSEDEEVVLKPRLQAALRRLNPEVQGSQLEEARRELMAALGPDLTDTNLSIHRLLLEGVKVQTTVNGHERGVIINVLDFADKDRNDYLAVNTMHPRPRPQKKITPRRLT